MRDRILLLDHLATAALAVGARPAVPGDCRDISAWRVGGFAPRFAVAEFDGSAAAELTGPAGGLGGPELWGVVRGNLRLLAYLKGNPIPIVDGDRGYAEELQDIGIATALYVAATVSAGAVTVTFYPAEIGAGR